MSQGYCFPRIFPPIIQGWNVISSWYFTWNLIKFHRRFSVKFQKRCNFMKFHRFLARWNFTSPFALGFCSHTKRESKQKGQCGIISHMLAQRTGDSRFYVGNFDACLQIINKSTKFSLGETRLRFGLKHVFNTHVSNIDFYVFFVKKNVF